MLELIFFVAIAAIIGLFTNWLAILMLFRPWREYRLFGMRLPFTPGLIPRRQQDLADKLGEVVDEELVTAEGIAKSLNRPAMEFSVKKAAIQTIGNLLNEAPTVGALAQRMFGEQALDRAEQYLVKKAVMFLRSEAGRERLLQLSDQVFEHLQGSLSSESVRQELARGFAAPLYVNLSEGTLTWQEALPESVRLLIEERIQAQVGPLLDGLAGWLEDPSVAESISRTLQDKVGGIPLIGPMAKSFLTPERVISDIVPPLQDMMTSPNIQGLVEDKLHDELGKFWAQPVGAYLVRLSADDFVNVAEKLLSTMLTRLFSDESTSRDKFRDVLINGLIAGANETTIGDVVHRVLDALAQWNVRDRYIGHTDEVDRWVVKLWRYLRGALIDAMPEVLEAINMREVVREKVASYPIPTLEKLVLSVVNRELKLITILGGVLGAIIGLIQYLISNLL